jgi:signal-transduction protein with cAMP-binding, CBS, and nucleotidyltransferase domain
MANDTKQRLGELVRVENARRKFGSAKEYCAVYVEAEGRVEPLMLTLQEYALARERATKNPEDMPGYRKRFTEKFRRRR